MGLEDAWLERTEMVSSNPLPFAFLTQKNPPVKKETRVRSLGQEDPLGKEMATHSRILAWEIPRRDTWRAVVHEVKKVRHALANKQQQPKPKPRRLTQGLPVTHSALRTDCVSGAVLTS